MSTTAFASSSRPGKTSVRKPNRRPRARSTSTRSRRTSRASTGSHGSSKASASAALPSGSLTDPALSEGVVVGFDTATADTAVCVTRGATVLHEALVGPGEDGGPRHSTTLLVEIERGVTSAGGWRAVDRIAVGLGPGSFVGIRIAIATARGLALSTGLPTSGVCTLDALGAALADSAGPDRLRLAVLDARRGEVFASLFAASGERIWGPLVEPPDELA